MVVNAELVRERIENLDEYLRLLERYQRWGIARLTSDRIVYGGVLHYLQLSAQIVLDVGAHLNAELNVERASGYREAVRSLGDVGVLPPDFAARVAELAGFRNVLIHEYLTVDPLKVQQALDAGLDDLRAFVVYVIDYLQEEGTIQRE